jgi:hypothetical protein
LLGLLLIFGLLSGLLLSLLLNLFLNLSQVFHKVSAQELFVSSISLYVGGLIPSVSGLLLKFLILSIAKPGNGFISSP